MINDNYLLTTPIASKLYNEVLKKLPIIDYHNHLDIKAIKENRKYDNIYELWIKTDPYKHRLMRIMGVSESYITGDKTPYEKFLKWCDVFPYFAGTPVFDWSLLELKRIFDVDLIPSAENASMLWDKLNNMLKTMDTDCILKKFNIEYMSPCVSITEFDNSDFSSSKIAPSLRCDDIINISCEFIKKLENVSDYKINNIADFEKALDIQMQKLFRLGCIFTDHALDNGFLYYEDDGKNDLRFKNIINGLNLSLKDKTMLSSHILRILAKLYKKYDFCMQLHIGAVRSTSSRLKNIAGPQGGFASIGNSTDIVSLTKFLDDVEKNNSLVKTIIFNLNPQDNAMFSVLSGSFSSDNKAAVICQGAPWWWCDHMWGIKNMLENYASYSVLSTFIGMTTDSRSILSFVRHEYFRRVFCMWLGEKIESGEYIPDFELWKNIAEKICYSNIKEYIKGR